MKDVEEEIAHGNEWYVGDQFAWARRPDIARIYDDRLVFFRRCMESAGARRRALQCLDAGCGDGYWLWRLQDLAGVEWFGCDYNPVRVERARSRSPRASIVQSDLLTYDPGHQFDVVLLNQVVEHVADDLAVFRHIDRWIRPGGLLIVGVPNEGNWIQTWRRRRKGAHEAPTDHVHFYTETEIVKKLCDTGWRVRSAYREVASLGVDRIDTFLLSRGWGYRLLKWLVRVWPDSCSDFYFLCGRGGRCEEAPAPG